jgi:triosephosphate isomerase (TIM)
MRNPVVAGNWKMYKTTTEARELVSLMVPDLEEVKGVEKVLCPPSTSLLAVRSLLEGSSIGLGAQNMHWETTGAFTGELSPPMIAELCAYVILGHSERRTYFSETDEIVNKKVKSAIKHSLIPIVCVGETLEENETSRTQEVVNRQIYMGLSEIGIADPSKIIIAYEPVWAIGTGKAATAEGANDVIGSVIRSSLAKLFGSYASQSIRILYGGSVKGNNAAEFFEQAEIDGALVGGASLNAQEFLAITRAAA